MSNIIVYEKVMGWPDAWYRGGVEASRGGKSIG